MLLEFQRMSSLKQMICISAYLFRLKNSISKIVEFHEVCQNFPCNDHVCIMNHNLVHIALSTGLTEFVNFRRRGSQIL